MKFLSSFLVASVVVLLSTYIQGAQKRQFDDEFKYVTCGSIIKLAHGQSGFKLHSHKIPYGSGSGQQSVTGFPNHDDNNSHWIVRAAHGETCQRGMPIKCGSTIRLFHSNTNKYLHSHLHTSPLSGNQEISAFEQQNGGDNWILKCLDGVTEWLREQNVELIHGETGKYLHSHSGYHYQAPIPGQLEVSASSRSSEYTKWSAIEGVYLAAPIY